MLFMNTFSFKITGNGQPPLKLVTEQAESLLRKVQETEPVEIPVINISENSRTKNLQRAVCTMPRQPQGYMKVNTCDFF